MERIYSYDLRIPPSECDSTAHLSVPGAFALFMDAAGEHAELLGLGAEAMTARGLFWMTLRTRVRFLRRPAMLEPVTLSTWPEPPSRLRCNRDYTLTQHGELLIAGKTEWVVMETATGKLHSADLMPSELKPPVPPVWDEPFSRILDDFAGVELLGEHRIMSTDIDFGGHMNNVAYVRALAGLFPRETWNAAAIREMEVVFRAPAFEGDTLHVQRRTTDGAWELRASDNAGQTVLLARIVTE